MKNPSMRFSTELIGEMSWKECILVCLEEESYTDENDSRQKYNFYATCVTCDSEVQIAKSVEDTQSACERFLDLGWRYTHTKEGFEANCQKCRPAARVSKNRTSSITR
jgi:hypothetical protein